MRALLFVPGSDERKLAKVGTFGADADRHRPRGRGRRRGEDRRAGDHARGDPDLRRRPGRDRARQRHRDRPARGGHRRRRLPGARRDAGAEDRGRRDARRRSTRCSAPPSASSGSSPARVRVLAIVETPRGIVRCDEILERAPPRTVTSIFGLGDFSVALGVELTAGQAELAYARGRVVVATRAAGMVPPIDGPYLDLTDEDGLVHDCRRAAQPRLPGQGLRLPAAGRADRSARSASSTDEEVAATRRLVEAFEEAECARRRVDPRSTGASSTTRSTTSRAASSTAGRASRRPPGSRPVSAGRPAPRHGPLPLARRARRRRRVAVRRPGDRDDARRLRRRRDQGRAPDAATTCASSAGRRTASRCGGR